MKVTIEGTPDEIKEVLQAIAGGREHTVNADEIADKLGKEFLKIFPSAAI